MCEEVSSTTPNLHCLPVRITPSNVENDSLNISRLVTEYLPARTHEHCFDKYSGHTYKFVNSAYPESILCEPDYFYQDAVFKKLGIAFYYKFSSFKICRDTHDNPSLEFFCGPSFKDFFLQTKRFLSQWHTIQNKQMPFVYEFFVSCNEDWIQCPVSRIT